MKMTVGEAIDAVMARIENGEIGGDDVDEAMGEVMACIGEGEFSAGDQIEAVIERRRIDLKLKVEEIYALWLVNTICGQGLVRLSQHIAHAAPPRGYTSRLPETGE